MIRAFFKFIFISALLAFLISAAVGMIVGLRFYFRLTRDLPRIEKLSDYRPLAVTTVYAEDGTVMAEVFKDQRRYPVKFEDIPVMVRNAFLAAEDANFYTHPGIDFVSILRALWVNFRKGETVQGASTITQQVVKSLLLTNEKTYERKGKEAILSYRLEKQLTKNEIFSIYLNEIYLGLHSYGVKAAARVHFRKELNELNLGEAAYLAALPQKPSLLADPKNRDEAYRRQHYVLQQMLKNRMITSKQAADAEADKLTFYGPEQKLLPETGYYYRYALEVLDEQLRKVNRKLSSVSPGGYQVYTAADVGVHQMGFRSLRRGLRTIDKRRGWRGPLETTKQGAASDLLDSQALVEKGGIEAGKIYRALVKQVQPSTGTASVQVGEFMGTVDLKRAGWAEKLIDRLDDSRSINISHFIKSGHIIEVSLDEEKEKEKQINDVERKISFVLDQTPEIEGALVLLSPLTGAVKAIVGGYDFQRSQFNRATQALRQPGSSFKPIIYLAALEYLNYTPATIVPDSPISLVAGNGKLWSPGNFDQKFLGPITLRTALQRSRNVVSVHLLNRIGIPRAIETARKVGITTPIGRDMSISLGTAEVKILELTRAYGVFAAGGWLADSLVVKSVIDRDGKPVIENRTRQKQVTSEENAFLMANMMKGVVERGTATVVKKLGKPVAGKTGTTNDYMDTWFIGYTPEWVCGVWIGFDEKRTIGKKETGGKVAAPVFLDFMEQFLAKTPPIDFDIPDGVVPVLVNASSGRPTDPNDPGAFLDYFKSGTEPSFGGGDFEIPKDYLSSDEF